MIHHFKQLLPAPLLPHFEIITLMLFNYLPKITYISTILFIFNMKIPPKSMQGAFFYAQKAL
mgnify:CR=1 FL=1